MKNQITQTPSLYTKADGKYYFTYLGTQYYGGSTEEKAHAKMKMIIEGLSDYPSVEKTVKEYLEFIQGNQSGDTVYNKKGTLMHFATFFNGTLISDLTVDDLERYKKELLKTQQKPTVNTNLCRISALFQYCIDRGYLKDNMVKKLPKLKVPNEIQPDFLTQEEADKLLSLCAKRRFPYITKRDHALFILILNAGLRRIEVTNFKWSDIDFEKRLLFVRNGKGSKSRVIPINETLYQELISLERKGEYVITTLNGGKISRPMLTFLTNRYIKKLNHHYKGRKRFSLHSLRATCLTRLAEKTVNPFVIQKVAGHANLRTTLRYVGVDQNMIADAMNRLDP